MNKTLSKKFIYVITVLALIAMMVPAMAIPVSAAPTLTMTIAGVEDGVDGRAFNISGSTVMITASEEPIGWSISNITTVPPYGGASFSPEPNPTDTVVYVTGIWGEANISAHFAENVTVTVNKKWGMLDHTAIQAPGQEYVTWSEDNKSWFAGEEITDTVYATFVESGSMVVLAAQGTILDWYLVSGLVDASPRTLYGPAANTWAAGLADAQYVQFIDSEDPAFDQWDKASPGWLGVHVQTVSGVDGKSTVEIGAWFEENVQIVVVPSYPNNPNQTITTEVTSYNFGTRELEVVPQVRWAGEKIVLEANFGVGVDGEVLFYLQNQSVGTLEGIDDDSEHSTVWAEVDDNGTARAILYSAVSGQADVIAALYPYGRDEAVTNEYAFRVYFLNFESLQLTDVIGKRSAHNAGLWIPENPYNDNFPAGYASSDDVTQYLNVSQDALERVQVRGWFVPPYGAQTSTRPATTIDIDADQEPEDWDDVAAPYGRWILPDDWARIGGYSQWQERRLHFDIMSSPADCSKELADDSPLTYDVFGVTSDNKLGSYYQGAVVEAGVFTGDVMVGAYKVIGPFAPGLEQMTPTGWAVPNTRFAQGFDTTLRDDIQTVVPDGALNAWDAPMPPAKIILEVMSGPGYFKDAMKTDIYYMNVGTDAAPVCVYTNPFYQILIPAHPLIPYTNIFAGGGYDWNSYDGVHGPYEFWTVINQPYMNATRPSDAMHPTKIEVYSDNHGEAMAWLNGDWNLDLSVYTGKGGADVPVNETVGFTTVQAMADYPYVRADQAILSNSVEKEWFWSGQVLGTDSHDFGTTPDGDPIGVPTDSDYTKMVLTAGNYTIDNSTGTINDGIPDNDLGFSNDKVVWVWACDRDGLIDGVLGTVVQWRVTGGAYITPVSATQISNYNIITQNIALGNGFVIDPNENINNNTTDGVILNDDRTRAVSVLRTPTMYEKQLFNKKWPLLYGDPTGMAPINFAVAAIDIYSDADVDVTVETILTGPDFGYPGQVNGNVYYGTNVDFAEAYPIDDPIIAGDANADGVVNAADITKVERIIMGLDAPNVNADTNLNGSIDMGDVVKISRIIRGLE